MNDTSTDETTVPIGPTAGVLVLTDDSGDPALEVARGVAAELADRHQVPVTLYDRSRETWADTPHSEGPIELDDERLADRPELVRQMRAVQAAGVRPRAWITSLPAISAIEAALVDSGADVVVVAKDMAPNLLERALQGRSLAATIATRVEREPHLDARVLEVDHDGSTADAGTI